MKHALTFTGCYLAITLFIAAGLADFGYTDTTSVSSEAKVPLASLTVTPGALQPAFSTNTTTTNYQVEAPTAVDSITTMMINGGGTPAVQDRSVPLGTPGSTIRIPTSLSAVTGGESTSTITVNQAVAPPQTPPPPPPPANAPDLIPEDDSCLLNISNNPASGCVDPRERENNITNVTQPRFQVSQLGSGETPNLYVDGNKVEATFIPETNTLQPANPLSNGAYTITSTVTSSTSGLESSPSQPLSITINTGSPGAPGSGTRPSQ